MSGIRNLAIVAHVDHGKTTMIDQILAYCKTLGDRGNVPERFMDSNDLEKERGITITSKHVSVDFEDTRVNIVDTPGHADFGGEVERVLCLADAIILLVDAVEGPMPQTTFVLKKAIQQGLKPLVVINKIDRPMQRAEEVYDEVLELFLELETPDEHLDFPFLYASGRDGWVQREPGGEKLGLDELMRFIVDHVPAPDIIDCDHVAVRVTAIEYSDYLGKMGIGRVQEGTLTKNMRVRVLPQEGEDHRDETVRNLFRYRGVEKVEVDHVNAGDIVAIAGLKSVDPGDTVTTKEPAEKLDPVPMDEPTISMEFSINTSPFAGKEGDYVTATKIGERLFKELERNVALKVENTASPDTWLVSGRGLLHLSILIENMRREGYEFAVSRPQVVTRVLDGVINEPYQAIYIETPEVCNGKIIELMSTNCAELKNMNSKSGSTMQEFLIPARGMIGMRSKLMTVSKGEAIVNSMFDSWQPMTAKVPARSTGSLVSLEQGEATAYSLAGSEGRGRLFIGPGAKVYPGMVVGENAKERDLGLNVVKGKKLTNVRASGTDKNIKLTPPTLFSLEENLEFLAQDEMLEVTPKSLRLRKTVLDEQERRKSQRTKL